MVGSERVFIRGVKRVLSQWKKAVKLGVMLALAMTPGMAIKKSKSNLQISKSGTASKKLPYRSGISRGTYQDFLEALGEKESSGDYSRVSRHGYLGKYQMGEKALIEAGFYIDDGSHTNDWDGEWTEAARNVEIYSQDAFLNDPEAQEQAVRRLAERNWTMIRSMHLHIYNGRSINGTTLTVSGMLAGAHLVGVGGLRKFILEGVDVADGNGMRISGYIEELGGYETPFDAPILLAQAEIQN